MSTIINLQKFVDQTTPNVPKGSLNINGLTSAMRNPIYDAYGNSRIYLDFRARDSSTFELGGGDGLKITENRKTTALKHESYYSGYYDISGLGINGYAIIKPQQFIISENGYRLKNYGMDTHVTRSPTMAGYHVIYPSDYQTNRYNLTEQSRVIMLAACKFRNIQRLTTDTASQDYFGMRIYSNQKPLFQCGLAQRCEPSGGYSSYRAFMRSGLGTVGSDPDPNSSVFQGFLNSDTWTSRGTGPTEPAGADKITAASQDEWIMLQIVKGQTTTNENDVTMRVLGGQFGETIQEKTVDGNSAISPGLGLNGTVYTSVEYNGSLYVGGSFTSAGGKTVSNIARWSGNNWYGVAGGVNGPVYSLAVWNGRLYVGGRFTTAGSGGLIPSNNIASTNGTAWEAGPAGGVNDDVYAMCVYNSNLWVGGAFLSYLTYTSNGTTWNTPANGLPNSVVRCIAVYQTRLYVGGDFTSIGGISANYIAYDYEGNWATLGSGMSAKVKCLESTSGNLYVGGDFTTANSVQVNYIGSWNGSAWSPLAMSGYTGVDGPVEAIKYDGSTYVYVGGTFAHAGGVDCRNIATWNPSTWASITYAGVNEALNGVDSTIYDINTFSSVVYIGGSFIRAYSEQGYQEYIGYFGQIDANRRYIQSIPIGINLLPSFIGSPDIDVAFVTMAIYEGNIGSEKGTESDFITWTLFDEEHVCGTYAVPGYTVHYKGSGEIAWQFRVNGEWQQTEFLTGEQTITHAFDALRPVLKNTGFMNADSNAVLTMIEINTPVQFAMISSFDGIIGDFSITGVPGAQQTEWEFGGDESFTIITDGITTPSDPRVLSSSLTTLRIRFASVHTMTRLRVRQLAVTV